MDAPRGWSYGPSLSVSATTLDVDAFDETGAQGLDLSYQKQSTDSLQFIVGFDISKAISTQFGVISPYARVQSIYESLDDKRNVDIRYVADTTGFFPGIRLTTTAPDRSRFLLGGGISGQFARGWSSFADAETIVGLRDTSGYTFTLGLRREF
jgi:outer membrane autotransporter protein